MVKTFNNIFSQTDIDLILHLPEVKKAKEDIDKKYEGSVYFTIDIIHEIQQILLEKLGLNLSNVPMRWIKGDTKPHVDLGENTFNNTYLVYITDSKGEFLIDGDSYLISKGNAYIFSEGLEHGTINTGLEPRLLLGPMSEEGFAVGIPIEPTTITANGETDTIHFYYDSHPEVNVYYTINETQYNGITYPITIVNTNPNPENSRLKVLFETDIPISFTNFYFICGSANIQFGSMSLKDNGTIPNITINTVSDYNGLIQNGTENGDGNSNIYIFNLKISVLNLNSTLLNGAGWFGQQYFAKGVYNCFIINCHSDGPIGENCGGIVGANCGGISDSVKIIYCSSSGNITGSGDNENITGGGGIIGANSSCVSVLKSYSLGSIGQNCGGIIGYNCQLSNVSRCYSTGTIGQYGGGIIGRKAEFIECDISYSSNTGNLSSYAGGIFGAYATSCVATNCYSLAVGEGGIFGNNGTNITPNNCYYANGPWNTETANNKLLYFPNPPNNATGAWINTQPYGQPYGPYEFEMGYSPYIIENIFYDEGFQELQIVPITFQNINAGNKTISAKVSNQEFKIIQVYSNNMNPILNTSISIDNTGAVSTSLITDPGSYLLYIKNNNTDNNNIYSITVMDLTVQQSIIPTQINNNSFKVSNLFLDDLENSILLAQTSNGGSGGDSFTIYDVLLSELVNEALINQ